MSAISTPYEGNDPHGNGVAVEELHDATLQHHFATKEQQFETSKIGMWLFLATEILMFGGLFAGFTLMQNRFPEAFLLGHEHLDKRLGALNTVVLLISSYTMVMAVHKARTNKKKALITYLSLTITCALIFLGVKYVEYSQKIEHGLLPGHFFTFKGDPTGHQFIFFSFYFLMTGVHGFHILVGVLVLFWILARASKGQFSSSYYTPVDLVGLYWHLVDLIWIYLFPLLYLIK